MLRDVTDARERVVARIDAHADEHHAAILGMGFETLRSAGAVAW
jgi:hypothetical protein